MPEALARGATMGHIDADDPVHSLWERHDMLHLPYRLLMVAKMLDRTTSVAVGRDAGLSLAQWRVLANLEQMEPCSAAELAEASQVDRAEISRAVVGLEKEGLLERQDHPASRVVKRLSLTDSGRMLAGRIGRDRQRFYRFLLEPLDTQERAQFDTLLLRIARRLQAYDPGGAKSEGGAAAPPSPARHTGRDDRMQS